MRQVVLGTVLSSYILVRGVHDDTSDFIFNATTLVATGDFAYRTKALVLRSFSTLSYILVSGIHDNTSDFILC